MIYLQININLTKNKIEEIKLITIIKLIEIF